MWIICSYILRSINKLVMHSWLELNWILQMRTWRKRSGVSIPFHFVWYIAFVLLQNCFFLYIWKHKGRWGNLHGAWFHLVPQYCQWHFAGRQQRQWRRNIQARRNIPVTVSNRLIRVWELFWVQFWTSWFVYISSSGREQVIKAWAVTWCHL